MKKNDTNKPQSQTKCVVYLPGYSSKNLNEVTSFSQKFTSSDVGFYVKKWNHWTDETAEFNARSYAKEIIDDLKIQGITSIHIAGKSLGTHVGIHLLSEAKNSVINVSGIVFLGIPYEGLNENSRKEYVKVLKDYAGPITVMQNRNDPHGSTDQIEKMLEGVDYKFIIKDADTHQYNYPEDVWEIIKSS